MATNKNKSPIFLRDKTFYLLQLFLIISNKIEYTLKWTSTKNSNITPIVFSDFKGISSLNKLYLANPCKYN